MRFALAPDEADAPTVVDPDAVLAYPVALESFEMVAGGTAKILQPPGRVQVQQLAAGHPFDRTEARHELIGEQSGRVRAFLFYLVSLWACAAVSWVKNLLHPDPVIGLPVEITFTLLATFLTGVVARFPGSAVRPVKNV